MPTISIKRDELFAVLQKTYTDEEFDELCFQYGLELDEVTTEKLLAVKEHGDSKNASEQVIFKIEIPANRYDLLCLEGLSQALLVYAGKITFPSYQLTPRTGNEQKLIIKPNTAKIRPYAVAAVLRDITFTPSSYASFIDLQDKLHQNLCRKRSLVAIGTHDLDTIQGPFTYDALPPDQIAFRPLNQSKEYSAAGMMELYATDSHLKHFLHIIKDSPVYPIIKDINGIVLSMPPIINGDHSKISLKTKNVFIECTATDLNKANIVLDTIVTMFSQHCSSRFSVEPVDVVDCKGVTTSCPKLEWRNMEVAYADINKKVGIKVSKKEICELLKKMGLSTQASASEELISVRIPPSRHDILHSCDLIEDAAIGYGFNNIRMLLPESLTIGDQFLQNRVSDLLRREIVAAGYTEALTFALCSRDDIADKLRHKIEDLPAVHIANPKTLEFQVARTTLIPGLLKTVAGNKKMPLPIKLFEISDVVVKDPSEGVGAKNIRHFCALYYGKTSGFEIVHGLLDRFMELLGVPYTPNDNTGYHIKAHSDASFFEGRCAQIIAHGHPVGVFGVLHPDVLQHFDLTNPTSVVEINVEPFL